MYDSKKMIMPGKWSISNRVQYHDIISNLELILWDNEMGWEYFNELEFLWIFLISSYPVLSINLKLNMNLYETKNLSFKIMKNYLWKYFINCNEC